MTDKFEKDINVPSKIMINNVDVSGCVYRDYKNRCYCDSSKENTGEKRLTGRGGCEYNPNCYYKQLKRIENQYNAVVEQNKSLQQQLQAEKEKVKEYKQALEEIKEIIEPIYCDCHGECEEYIETGLKQILQKCEVLDA